MELNPKSGQSLTLIFLQIVIQILIHISSNPLFNQFNRDQTKFRNN